MCGRYTLRDPAGVARALSRLGADMPDDEYEQEWRPRYNVAPTQSMPVICRGSRGNRQIETSLMRWGITLRPAGEEKQRLLINARAESAWQKPSFRASLQYRRCIIPADGFFEWRRVAGTGAKAEGEPYFIRRRDDMPMWLAGFFEEPAGEGGDSAFVIMTTGPNAVMAAIHDRMPVILAEDSARAWLGAVADAASATGAVLPRLCVPWQPDDLVATAVGPAVNNTRNDHAGCLVPSAEAARHGDGQGLLALD
ncbi:SOS response-associated peptidase [Termitidicoccus mucosus]|uniref:SOS response-associated peptidase n=1 Tax=Termitidicoccus mucosus TaxID=1184151 RepID=UPI0008398DFA